LKSVKGIAAMLTIIKIATGIPVVENKFAGSPITASMIFSSRI